MPVCELYKLLNGDSILSASPELTSCLHSMCGENFLRWMGGSSFAASVQAGLFGSDVTLISAEEIRKFRRAIKEDEGEFEDGGDHPDLLGVYVSHHPWSHRPAILVSPEKVMAACLRFGRSTAGPGSDADAVQARQAGPPLPMMRLYPVLLAHVAFHELAHAVMCEAAAVPCPGHRSWQAIGQIFDAGEQQAAEAMLESAISFKKRSCNWRPRQRLTRQTAHACHTIEESLANAIALRQRYDAPTVSVLRDWVSRQPPSYRAGLHWEIDDEALFTTATSWTHAKPLLHAMDAHQNADPQVARRLLEFHAFAAKLRSSGCVMHQAVDFRDMLA